MSEPPCAPGDPTGPDPTGEAAAAALHDAFARLHPQGSDAWNFLGAFTHLGDRYGPYQPGASELSKLVGESRPAAGGTGLRDRLRRRAGDGPGGSGASSELSEAMGHVVEAFRFLSARVRTLEERVARQDQPVDGPAWLVPAAELGEWAAPVVARLVEAAPQGPVLHGDCGEGGLLHALAAAGVEALGAEPRGAVALRALEQGCRVAIIEVTDDLAARDPSSLGGLVLSGVVDRLPLHALLDLLTRARHALCLGAPIVVVASNPAAAAGRWDAAARDLVDGRPLHDETWAVLLTRAGFVGAGPLGGPAPGDGRFAVTASMPT